MKSGIKSTQELIMHLFKKRKPSQKNMNYKNNNLLLNHKNNIFQHNLTNRAKYKTSKNSPENILLHKNLSDQKKYLDKSNNNSKIQMNNISKVMLSGQKKDEIIKKKIQHIKEKKMSQKSNNNSISMNITNNIYQNYINNIYIKNKNIFINKINFKKNKNQNMTKKNNSINQKKANTARGGDITKRANSNYELKKSAKNVNNINNDEMLKKSGSKYLNLINQYIASVSAVTKQPHRPNNQKNRFMTINAKKVKDIYKQNSMSNSQIYKKLGITMENTNIDNMNNINNINKIKNSINNIYNNINQNNNNLKNHFIFSSTSNSLNKKTKKSNQKPTSFRFELRKINRTTYQNKQQNRIHSLEKSIQNNNNINHSSINRKINSIAFVKNFNSPSITMYNKQNSEILQKNLVNNNMNNNNNINKYLFNGVNHIVDLKRKSIEKSINHLYKQKQKQREKKFNYLISIKEVKDNMSLIGMNYINNINNFNKKNKSSMSINFAKDIKKEKDTKDNKDNNLNNNSNNNSHNVPIQNKQKDNLEIKPKKEEKNYYKEIKTEKDYISQEHSKEKEELEENEKKEDKEEKENKEEKEEKPKIINKTEKENKNVKKIVVRDKDLSCTENDNDTLLEYINLNIDYIPNHKKNNQNQENNTEISESNESLLSTLKDNGKYTCYSRDMEIISNYIKKFYKKNKKYPTTKMKFYKYGRLLGKGAFGKVNLGLHTLTGRLVAIKSINKEKIKNERQKKKIKQETTIMETLSKSKNIVKIFETYETKKHICIVMEYICAGDLLTYIKKRSKLTEPVAQFIFKQIILGIKYIHDNNIIHRDIKLDNILLDLDNNIKICDFGVSRTVNKDDIMFEQCGTPAYIAPEILINKGYEGFGVDIWSAGVVLYAMLSGTVPFKGNNLKELHNLIINGDYKEVKGISREAEDLIKRILEVDPNKRIKTEEILNHPWLKNLDFNFWKNQNLFTNAEYVLLAKSNVDYRNIAFKEDMIENFDIRNLDTVEENINKNVNTKSLILAPFNTSVSDNEENEYYSEEDDIIEYNKMIDVNNPDLKILNGIIKYNAKVRDLNRNYELNNNQEIDNGVVITQNDSEDKEKKLENNGFNISYINKFQSRHISPPNELIDNYEEKDDNGINENALDILQNLGYKKAYVKKYLTKNEFNYATTSYNLIVKYCFS